MADLLLSNGETKIIKIYSDGEKVDVDIDREVLRESLIKTSSSGDEDVLISYGTGEPNSSTPGKLYIQI